MVLLYCHKMRWWLSDDMMIKWWIIILASRRNFIDFSSVVVKDSPSEKYHICASSSFVSPSVQSRKEKNFRFERSERIFRSRASRNTRQTTTIWAKLMGFWVKRKFPSTGRWTNGFLGKERLRKSGRRKRKIPVVKNASSSRRKLRRRSLAKLRAARMICLCLRAK